MIVWRCLLTSIVLCSSLSAQPSCHTPCDRLAPGPVTIFVHGTFMGSVFPFVKMPPRRRGLYEYLDDPIASKNPQVIAQALHAGAHEGFAVGTFYKFYWSGLLCPHARKKAAQHLCSLLSPHEGPVRIIAHSHGCNVVLLLAHHEQALTHKRIDSVIFMAPPVQKTTKHYATSPLFKKIYSLYSAADIMQIADPQYRFKDKFCEFSGRTFEPQPNMQQARILLHGKNPQHRTFRSPMFFTMLPRIISLLDTIHDADHVTINVPAPGMMPYLFLHGHCVQPRPIGGCT